MSVPQRVSELASAAPEHPAMILVGGATLGYGRLHQLIEQVADALVELGVERTDTVGIALRDGAEMALSFLGTSAVAAAAPFNPSYRRPELEFEIDDLGLSAMIVGTGRAELPAALEAARARGIPLIRVVSTGGGDGFGIDVDGEPVRRGVSSHRSGHDDVALVLHTSGTTARPKIVPLRHSNISASAEAIAGTLELGPADRGCNVMPLFHIHGLVAGLCSSLVAGATVMCSTGFSAPDMLGWLRDHRVSWYTAVPTMHQALLERAAAHPAELEGVGLRFIRSSSASLAPSVMAELESTFGCPVIEAYGMTEAAHQMASNPLPPGVRKPGSVGPAAGPKVAIMDDDGDLVPTGMAGEVVIAGPNVMSGYRDNPEANAEAFNDGWFRTGDQGRLDGDGYLFLTGRLKEIINRGGENVSPREVDEVLLEHPGVAQAVTFAVPDRRLGEQVAAAVVAAPAIGASMTEREVREFVAARLAPYKVPRRVVFVDAIPKGPSGKLQRIGLADTLGLADLDAHEAPAAFVEPTTAAELLMAELWCEALGLESVSAADHFLDVGGDSLTATRLLTRVRDEIDIEVSMLAFFDAPTIAEQARLVEDLLLAEEDAG